MFKKKSDYVSRRSYRSRLTKNQKSSNIKSIIYVSLITVLLISGMFYGGMNMFVRIASWWADKQTMTTDTTNNNVIPPSVPRLIISNRVVRDSKITLGGFAEPNIEVSISNNDQVISKTLADNNGQFVFSEINLVNGDNIFRVRASDKLGNFSQYGNPEKITYDNVPPELTIESPSSGADIRGAQNQVVEIKGRTEQGVRVWINDKLVIIGNNGNFVSTYRLSVGQQEIVVKAIDLAGNETEEILVLSYSP